MWQHGIHGSLELLPHCLPHSLEHLLAFYLAYNMVALVELVPAFEVVAKRRSSLVQQGCHLAILARPSLQQLFYYSMSLGVGRPYPAAAESILTLFDPVFHPVELGMNKSKLVDPGLIRLHSILFTRRDVGKFDATLDAFLDLLDKHIDAQQCNWKVHIFLLFFMAQPEFEVTRSIGPRFLHGRLQYHSAISMRVPR